MIVSMKKKLLILSKDQFGYHIDTFKYCEHLKDDFEITYICLDRGLDRVVDEKIKVRYITFKHGTMYRFWYFIWNVIKIIKKEKFDVIFCVYFRFCFLLPIFSNKRKIILDIRTGSVSNSKAKRFISDMELKLSTLFFKNITIISDGLAKKLKLQNYIVLPLGADQFDIDNIESPNISEVKLLYVGTLTNRRVYDTVVGYSNYIEKNGYDSIGNYTIIGSGTESETNKIESIIHERGLEGKVKLLGRIPYKNLDKYFNENTVGVSYIPITDYYTHQPPTKTFEYLMSGLVCIATETIENKKVINEGNGVLCTDCPDGFENAIGVVVSKMKEYDRYKIIESVEDNSWYNISGKILKPILNKIN